MWFWRTFRCAGVAARFLTGLAGQAPLIATGAEITYVDTDDTVRATYGYAKQGSGVVCHARWFCHTFRDVAWI